MEAVTYYYCGICHSMYHSKEECLKCQNSHLLPVKIGASRFKGPVDLLTWDPVSETLTNKKTFTYPSDVYLQFEDGIEVKYICEGAYINEESKQN